MHWATSQKKRPSLPEPQLRREEQGEDDSLGTKRVKTEHLPEGAQGSKQPSASVSSALQDFRRGGHTVTVDHAQQMMPEGVCTVIMVAE